MKRLLIKCAVLLIALAFIESCKETDNNTSSNNSKDAIKIDSSSTEELSVTVQTIKIGDQEWMTEDINATFYNNGDPISEAKKDHQWVDFNKKKVGCYRILNNGTYIYNIFAVNDDRGLLPDGFSIPTVDDFFKLFKFLGGGESQSGKATQALALYNILVEEFDEDEMENYQVEIKPNGSSGFKAKEGGFVYGTGNANDGPCSYWWTSPVTLGGNVSYVDIGYCSQDLGGGSGESDSTYGFAIRGIKK